MAKLKPAAAIRLSTTTPAIEIQRSRRCKTYDLQGTFTRFSLDLARVAVEGKASVR